MSGVIIIRFAVIVKRHNVIRNQLADMATAAGCHALIEQRTSTEILSDQAYDLPSCGVHTADVAVVAADPRIMLIWILRWKCYAPQVSCLWLLPPTSPSMADKLRPVILETGGYMSQSANVWLRHLHQLYVQHALAHLGCTPAHAQHLAQLHFWQKLSVALIRHAWTAHAQAALGLEGLAAPADAQRLMSEPGGV